MKYFAAIACLLALSASTNADGLLSGLDVYAPKYSSLEYYSYPSYAFEYAVRDPHTGDNKAQWEKRDGDVVRGAYSLVEPDGSVRVVEYRADDKTGFNAVVKRIGPNIHPVSAPIYKAPLPVIGYKAEVPISIGPVAGIEKLSSAPLINGPYLGAPILKKPLLAYPESIYPIVNAPIPDYKSLAPLQNYGGLDLALLGKGLVGDKILYDLKGYDAGLGYNGYAGIGLGLGYKGGYGH
ncbi:unnamed protein product, partial [Brenthis ino]